MPSLSAEAIPSELRPLQRLAERFGISDDSQREDAVRCASASDLKELVSLVRSNEDLLDAWLAGSESKGRLFSDEYIAFSAMRMAADYASAAGSA